jgi:hypothetical protein
MAVWKSLRFGLRKAASRKRVVLFLFIANLLAGLLFAIPLRNLLMGFAGHSLAGKELVHGVRFDFLFELGAANPDAAGMLSSLLFLGGAVSWLLSLFLSGGALTTLAADGPYQAADFWGASGRLFGRFIRLALWSLLLLAALSLLPLIGKALQRLLYGSDPYENVIVGGAFVLAGLILTALFFFRVCFDYARIDAVVNDERKMRRSLWRAVRFAIGKFFPTVGVALVMALASGLLLLIYLPLSTLVDGSTEGLVMTGVAAQQLFLTGRVTLRLIRYGSEIALYRNLRTSPPAPVPPPPMTDGVGLAI